MARGPWPGEFLLDSVHGLLQILLHDAAGPDAYG